MRKEGEKNVSEKAEVTSLASVSESSKNKRKRGRRRGKNSKEKKGISPSASNNATHNRDQPNNQQKKQINQNKQLSRRGKARLKEQKSREGEISSPSRVSDIVSKSSDFFVCKEVTDSNSISDENLKMLKMTEACRTILECIGEDPNREGLLKTPDRWAKALLFMTKGYAQSTQEVTNDAIFSENHSEMVVVRDIDIHSLCEHHMVPFTGKVHVGYIPNGQILGLSKIARIAEVFARRLQVQERLTRQIADAVVEAINPMGVAVVVECTHFCMVMRGVQKVGASTVTSSVRGVFETNPMTRSEFFSIINSNQLR
uniref:GTP cyclohydrolase 1 n=1 Tax=Proboscia inermis TaxID=420281 RepID=A0A7S0CFU9_9STRA